MTLGERLRKLRKKKNLTTREMSKILNIGKSTFSNYENDVRRPDYETLSRIADHFNVSTDYLITGKSDSNANHSDDILKVIGELILDNRINEKVRVEYAKKLADLRK